MPSLHSLDLSNNDLRDLPLSFINILLSHLKLETLDLLNSKGLQSLDVGLEPLLTGNYPYALKLIESFQTETVLSRLSNFLGIMEGTWEQAVGVSNVVNTTWTRRWQRTYRSGLENRLL